MFKLVQNKIVTILLFMVVFSFVVGSATVYGDSNSGKNKINVINLNSATVKEIMNLPGIGKKKANAIVAYRQENGGFHSVDELKNIKGIGKKIFAKIKDYVAVE